MQFILDFKNTATAQEIENFLQQNNATTLKVFNNFEKTYLVSCDNTPPTTDIIEFVIHDDEHPIQLLNTIVYSDQSYGKNDLSGPVTNIVIDDQNWWKSFVMWKPKFDVESYQVPRRGQSSTVYVLDSGIETSHAEFVGQTVTNLWSFNGNFTDTAGHGTAIASVIVGNTCGITNATVKSVKIFENRVPTKQSDLVSALDAIYQDIVTNEIDFPVVNCSWTISRNLFIESKIRDLINAGVFFVASAGNSGSPITDITPASMPELITIGAYNSSLTPCDFSNYTGPHIASLTYGSVNHGELDGWAPGENIYVAGLGNTYGMMAGTSISAGIHSAVMANNLSFEAIDFRGDKSYYQWGVSTSISRKDILDLHELKYSTSVNAVSSMVTDFEMVGERYGWLAAGQEGSSAFMNIFNPRLAEKLEIIGELPEGLTIKPTGKLVGKFPSITERVTSLKIPLKLTKLSGAVIEEELEIVVYKPEFNPDTEKTGNDILDLKLQAGCSQWMGCFSGFCVDNCGFVGCDFQEDKLCPNPGVNSCFCMF